MYRYHDEQNVQAGSLAIAAGSYTFTVPPPANSAPQTYAYIANIKPSFALPGSIVTLNSKDTEQPETKSYSFTISQRMPWASTAEVSYVGNSATNLSNYNSSVGNLNALPYGALYASAYKSLWGSG